MLDLNGSTWQEFETARQDTNTHCKAIGLRTILVGGLPYTVTVYTEGIAQAARLDSKRTDKVNREDEILRDIRNSVVDSAAGEDN